MLSHAHLLNENSFGKNYLGHIRCEGSSLSSPKYACISPTSLKITPLALFFKFIPYDFSSTTNRSIGTFDRSSYGEIVVLD